jgi:hypothetical protein
MERYPEHRFARSQAQQFKWLEDVSMMTSLQIPYSSFRLHSNTLRFLNVSRRKWRLASSILSVVRGSRICLRAKPSSGNPLWLTLFRVTIRQAMLHCLAPGLVWTHCSIPAIDQRGGHEVLLHTEVELVCQYMRLMGSRLTVWRQE